MISCTPSGAVSFVEGNQPGVCKRCGEYWHDHFRVNEGKKTVSGGNCSPYGGFSFMEGKRPSFCNHCGRTKNEHYNASNLVIARPPNKTMRLNT